jgi:Tfp pilus tip-associated adhesin PilY1
MLKFRRLAASALFLLLATTARGDDKDILRRTSAMPNVLIVFGNSQTTQQTISTVGASNYAWDGEGDSANSKMGLSKEVIKQFVADYPKVNFGLTTFAHNPNAGSISASRKHWLYAPTAVDFPHETWNEPVGTVERWGDLGEGPCTSVTNAVLGYNCAAVSPAITLPAGATVTGPFFAVGGTGSATILLTSTSRLLITKTAGGYGDAYTNSSLSTLTLGDHSMEVTKQYQELHDNGQKGTDWYTQASTVNHDPGTVTIGYVPVPSASANPDFFFTSGSDVGKAMGFLRDADLTVQSSCSGIEIQNTGYPIVFIPHDYTWGTGCANPPQNSIPCISRLLRPQAALFHYGGGTSYPMTDPDYSGYNAAPNSSTWNSGKDGKDENYCAVSLRGEASSGQDWLQNQAMYITQHVSQAPIKDLVDNIENYFQNPKYDGFTNGIRTDDPNKACRKTAVILVYDNFAACQGAQGLNSLAQSELKNLAAWGVPVYVIGLGANTSSTTTCTDYSDSTQTGACIAKLSGAFIQQTGLPGYFPVTSAAGLYQAFSDIVSILISGTRDFASASISSVQAGGDQMAYLATFNPPPARSIWNGRINGYKLDVNGAIKSVSVVIPTTIPDPNSTATPPAMIPNPDPLAGQTLVLPSTDSSVLKWNAGMSLQNTPGTGGTDGSSASTVLKPGASSTTTTYTDVSSIYQTYTLATRTYPGRKIVFSLPHGTTPPITAVPLVNTATIPEDRLDLTAVAPASDTNTGTWAVTKALLGPQVDWTTTANYSPASLLANTVSQPYAQQSIQFIWGDRDTVSGALMPGGASKLKLSQKYLGLKMGDVFHSNPALVGPPGNYFYNVANLGATADHPEKGYAVFATKYKNRRRVLFAGANDGLFHAFDVGVWDRDRSVCNPPSSSTACYDLGTGQELFAYAPRTIFPVYNTLKNAVGEQTKADEWTVDGPPSAADVFIDNSHNGTPIAADRVWRTVLVAGLREGSPLETSGGATANSYGSYFALDVTDPDGTDSTGKEMTGDFTAPACLDGATAACSAEWPRVLWEITDRGDADAAGTPGAGYPDMGETWSKPGIGRVRVCTSACGTGSAVYDYKFVAIFGGGFDRDRTTDSGKMTNHRGNWLYVVDIETGTVLYRANAGCKRTTAGGACTTTYFGSIPSEVGALDLNGDGTLELAYFGDTNGRMWRIDLSNLRYLGSIPTARWANKISIPAADSSTQSGLPFLLFEAPQPVATTTPPNQFFPIFFRPVAVSLGDTTSGAPVLGIAFGTGDRDDIIATIDTSSVTYSQRYYYVLDRRNVADPTQDVTKTESDLQAIASSTASVLTSVPQNGWYLKFAATGGERLITDSLAVNGLLYYSTFTPFPPGASRDTCANPIGCGNPSGQSRFYTVSTTTGNPLAGVSDRGAVVQNTDFVTNPIFFVSGNMQGNVAFMTSGGTFTTTKPPRQTSSALKEWKER